MDQGGLKHKKPGMKEVVHYANTATSKHYLIQLYKLCNSKRPERSSGKLNSISNHCNILKEMCGSQKVTVAYNMLQTTVK